MQWENTKREKKKVSISTLLLHGYARTSLHVANLAEWNKFKYLETTRVVLNFSFKQQNFHFFYPPPHPPHMNAYLEFQHIKEKNWSCSGWGGRGWGVYRPPLKYQPDLSSPSHYVPPLNHYSWGTSEEPLGSNYTDWRPVHQMKEHKGSIHLIIKPQNLHKAVIKMCYSWFHINVKRKNSADFWWLSLQIHPWFQIFPTPHSRMLVASWIMQHAVHTET